MAGPGRLTVGSEKLRVYSERKTLRGDDIIRRKSKIQNVDKRIIEMEGFPFTQSKLPMMAKVRKRKNSPKTETNQL